MAREGGHSERTARASDTSKMPGLTAKYLQNKARKNSAAAHARAEDDDAHSMSSEGSAAENDVSTHGAPAMTERSGLASRASLRAGLVGRASWREARKYLGSR